MRTINYHTDTSQITKNLKTRTNTIETYHHRKPFALEQNSKKEEKKHLPAFSQLLQKGILSFDDKKEVNLEGVSIA